MSMLKLGLALALCGASACQFDDRCGDDDLVYARGLCTAPPVDAGPPPPPPPVAEGGTEAGAAPSQCEGACELIGRCLAENTEAAAFLENQLPMLGFAGAEREGCVSYCDANSGGAGDEAVLACLKTAEASAMCDPSNLGGALPAVSAVDMCCEGRADSEYCVAVCTALSTNQAAYGLVASCKAIAP